MLAAPEDGNSVAAIVKLIGREIPADHDRRHRRRRARLRKRRPRGRRRGVHRRGAVRRCQEAPARAAAQPAPGASSGRPRAGAGAKPGPRRPASPAPPPSAAFAPARAPPEPDSAVRSVSADHLRGLSMLGRRGSSRRTRSWRSCDEDDLRHGQMRARQGLRCRRRPPCPMIEQVSEVYSTSGQYDLLMKCHLPDSSRYRPFRDRAAADPCRASKTPSRSSPSRRSRPIRAGVYSMSDDGLGQGAPRASSAEGEVIGVVVDGREIALYDLDGELFRDRRYLHPRLCPTVGRLARRRRDRVPAARRPLRRQDRQGHRASLRRCDQDLRIRQVGEEVQVKLA